MTPVELNLEFHMNKKIHMQMIRTVLMNLFE